ncbi:MAG: hypothetical protein ACLS6Y_01965 [Streptococcus salivarius]
MKKYLYSGALALAAILTLSACAKPKLDAKLSVNDIVYMSGSDLKLKDDQTLVEVSFKLENTSEDMENELKTSAKQFYLKDKDGKKVTASKLDKGDLPTLFNKNKNVEDATDDFGKLEADDYKTVSLFFEVNNDESYKLYFESKDEKTEGQTVSTNLKDFDGKTTTNVKKAVDAYFNAVLLGGKAKTTANLFLTTWIKLRANLTNISQIAFNTAMMQLITSNQPVMKFQKFLVGFKQLTVNAAATLLTTLSSLKIRQNSMSACQLSV